MAIKKCEFCNTEYDDEIYDSCPECAQNDAEQDLMIEDASQDLVPEDAMEETAQLYEAFDEGGELVGDAIPDKGNTKLALTITAIVLAVLIVICGGWLAYKSLAGVAPDTIDVDDFTMADIEGTYKDDVNGIYYTFTINASELEIPSADSSASASGEIKKFDGTFVSGISESFVPEIVAEYYISYNEKTEDYEAYKEKNKISGDDFVGYINANKLQSELDDFDAQQGISQYYADLSVKGYWKYTDGQISLYSDSGAEDGVLEVTKNGLVNSNTLFVGKVSKKGYFNSNFVLEDKKNGYTQTIRTYKDGYCILETYGEEAEAQLSAGTYEIAGDEMVIEIGGGKNRFRFVDFGITGYLFNK